ncbi:MAG: NAD(P)/FAD-dependent oxidoreductase, partial [Hyphomicrobiales bacterium]
RQLEPSVSEAYQCGVYLPDEGMIVDPGALLHACVAALRKGGARFVKADVRGIEFGSDCPVSLKTSEGPLPFRSLVIAAGAWSARLAAVLDGHVPLETQRGYHVMLPDSGVELRRPVVAADAKCFITPMEHGLRVAGTVEFAGLEASPDMRRADALVRHARRMFPQLSVERKAEWMGHRPCLPDTIPVIGRSPRFRNVFYAFGHGHLGLTGAPMTAQLISDLVLERPAAIDVSPYRFDRF